jgi:hypothetical protein
MMIVPIIMWSVSMIVAITMMIVMTMTIAMTMMIAMMIAMTMIIVMAMIMFAIINAINVVHKKKHMMQVVVIVLTKF